MTAVRVLVVDDSAVMRSFLRDVLSSDSAIEVVGVAADADAARRLIKLHKPDVVTLDIEMPGMDGVTFLEHMMRMWPRPVIMVSSLSQRGATITLRALEMGAVDFVAKPRGDQEQNWQDFTAEIILKVKNAASAHVPLVLPELKKLKSRNQQTGTWKLVLLGGSTGAVPVVQSILQAVPLDSPPILIALHMPPRFTRQFAERLDGLCAIKVQEAGNAMAIEPGNAYVAPGDSHMTVRKRGQGYACRLESGPRVNGHIPSVDVLFESAARAAGADAVGIILTGMGRDGATGLKAMKDVNAVTACQNENTSLIFGMPKVAFQEGAVRDQLPVGDIATYIMDHAGMGE
jgi:two-component system, chemotaxis family, protein-glutamate methylesterase/glutaminase